MRVLVTGASGFVGGHVAAWLDAAGHEVIATGRDKARLGMLALQQGKRVPADLAHDSLAELLSGCESIVHCAALAAPWGPRQQFLRQNVLATERLLQAAVAAGGVRRFVHLSSPSIYFQPRDQFHIAEPFTPPAVWPTSYAETKWLSECLVREPRYQALKPLILRPRAIYGPGDTSIAPRLLAVASRGYFPLVDGGRARIDITYVDNVVDAVELALHAPDSLAGRAFNVTNGAPVRVSELLREWFDALHLRVRFVTLPRALAHYAAGLSEWLARLRPGQPEPRLTRYGLGLLSYSQTLNIEAARRELGYEPQVSNSDGLVRHADWHARHD